MYLKLNLIIKTEDMRQTGDYYVRDGKEWLISKWYGPDKYFNGYWVDNEHTEYDEYWDEIDEHRITKEYWDKAKTNEQILQNIRQAFESAKATEEIYSIIKSILI
jgi:hypothetical protein